MCGFFCKILLYYYIKMLEEEPESRREWILERFAKACAHLKEKRNFKVWQNGYHAGEIYTQHFLDQNVTMFSKLM
jgi:hypothetical protein